MDTFQNICVAVAIALLGVGVGVMSMSPPDFVIARGATIGFAIAITAACVLWLSGNPAPIWEKVVVGGLAAILTYAGCPLAFNWGFIYELDPSAAREYIPRVGWRWRCCSTSTPLTI